MAKLVLKFGGTSVGTPERIEAVARRVARERRAGNELVVVVSAMGETTDELLALAGRVSPDPRRRHPRELDMLLTAGERIAMALLAMAIREAGVEAISFTGSQAAILTDGTHTGARIVEVRATRVREALEAGRVVIVAGFQGVSPMREVTTLGRGGSDTTAVALAAALGAERCDIYTDVDGVYTADPRRVPTARRIRLVDYEEMLELASSGAGVVHPRAVEIGARYGVPIRVLSSFREDGDGGTLITRKERGVEDLVLTGLASERGFARLVLRGLPAGMRSTSAVLGRLAGAGVSVDMVAQADRADGRQQLQLSVREDSLVEARGLCDALVAELGGDGLDVQERLARVALVGTGMHDRPGVYARAFEVLLDEGVEVHGLSTSAISIALLIDAEHEERALRTLHDAFGLGEARP
ncbi:MAG TPA: aspartate kinase [Longimicrobiales bacterium]